MVYETFDWDKKVFRDLANEAISSTLSHLGYNPAIFEIAILTCDDNKIAELNYQFCNNKTKTNVLSWPELNLSAKKSGELPVSIPITRGDTMFLGNIAMSYQYIKNEAEVQNKKFQDHVFHLLVHSTLHLLGFVHKLELDANIMEKIEVEILAKASISDPYRIH